MKISIKTLRTVFFYCAYLTFLSFSTFGHIPILGGYLKLITNFGILLLIVIFLNGIHQYKIKELQIFIGLFIYSFLLIRTANYYGIFKLALLIVASKGIDFRKCVKYDLISRLIMVIIMFGLFLQGIAPDVTSNYNGTIRHSIGFENANHVGMMAFIIIVEIIYLYRAYLGILQYAFAIGIIILADLVAGSRTAELMTIVTLFFVTIYKFFPQLYQKKGMRLIMKYCPLVCSIVTLLSVYLYELGSSVAFILNQIFSGRFSNIVFYYTKYGLSLFGTDTSNAGRTNDSLYGYCWIGLGAITFFLLLYCYMKTIDSLFENNKSMAIILTCFMVYGLSERLWMNVDYNIMMLAFRNLVYHDLEGVEFLTKYNRKHMIKLQVKKISMKI